MKIISKKLHYSIVMDQNIRNRPFEFCITHRLMFPMSVFSQEDDPAPNPDDPEDFPELSAGR